MTEDTGLSSIALAWVEAVQARGVRLSVRGKQLEILPKTAYSNTLTSDERATLKRCKAAIIDVVREGKHATTKNEPEAAPAPRAAKPEPCKWCDRAPCIGESHPAFLALHPEAKPKPYDLAQLCKAGITVKDPFTSGLSSSTDDPVDVMMKMLGKPHPWDY